MKRVLLALDDASLGALVGQLAAVRLELRAQGADDGTIDATTERMVRDRWPTTREWKFLCEACGDTGWAPVTCERHGHAYEAVRPCVCVRAKAAARPPADYREAGKMSKPLARVGR